MAWNHRHIASYFLTCYPFISAGIMAMFTKERLYSYQYAFPPLDLLLILLYVMAFLICGVHLKFRWNMPTTTLVIAIIQCILTIHVNYLSKMLGITYWGRVRHVVRSVAVVASYLLFLSKILHKNIFIRAAMWLMAFYGMASAAMLFLDPTYDYVLRTIRDSLHLDVDLTHIVRGIGCSALIVSSLTLLTKTTVRTGSLILSMALTSFVGFFDIRTSVWIKKHRMDYWLATRLSIDNFLAAIAIIHAYYPKHLKASPKECKQE